MKSIGKRTKVALALALSTGLVGSAAANSIVTDWNTIVVETAIKHRPAPTVSTHFMATVFTAGYDAWACFDENAVGFATPRSIKALAPADTNANKAEALSFAIYETLLTLVPANKAAYDAFLESKGYDPESTSDAAELGRLCADYVLEVRLADGSNAARGYANDRLVYVPQNDPVVNGAWQPVLVNGKLQKALTPHWGSVTPFALTSGDQFRPPAPAPYGSEIWNDQIEELLNYSANLTNEMKAVVEYWLPQAGTPPMVLGTLAGWVSEQEGYGLDEDVKLFFLIHNAMFDASIASWEAKFFYDYERPISAIRALGDQQIQAWGGPGQGTVTMAAKDWMPYQPAAATTPPFAEYVSGHSTFSGAWAEIMRSFTGSDTFGYSVTIDELKIEQVELDTSVTLTFPTFTDAVAGPQGSGISRLYGGIHWRQGNLEGQILGKKVGEATWDRGQTYFNGTARPAPAALAALNDDEWTLATFQDFTAPVTTGSDDKLVLGVEQPGDVFGFWQTPELDPLAKGSYQLHLTLEASEREQGTTLPELRIRVLKADNSVSAMLLVADTNPSAPYPTTAVLPFESDGETAFRVAIDVLSFTQVQKGTIRVTDVDVVRADTL